MDLNNGSGKLSKLRTMHLFAGAGGGLLADLILGHSPIIAVEWDRYACQVLRERAKDGWFPGLQVWEGDVRLFDPSEYTGKVDCIHAGFPCQDISVAGKQAGVSEGTRSGLYREVLRIADIVRPRYLFLENVAAILNNGLGTVLADLASLGYDCRWLCIRASDVGAPHHRDRWFMRAVCNAKHAGWNAAEISGSIEQRSDSYSTWSESSSKFEGSSNSNVADSKSEQRNGIKDNSGISVGQKTVSKSGNGLWPINFSCTNCGWKFESGRITKFGCPKCGETQPEILADTNSTQCEGNECTKRVREEHPDISSTSWWDIEPRLGRVVDGVPNRVHRLKCTGNAQVPIQAATAWRLLND